MDNRNYLWILFVLICLNIKRTFAIGPSCTVTSMMPGAMFASSMEGSCYATMACKSLKGIAIGSCGSGNVCCVFPRTCDAVSAQNHTYFINPGYPAVFNASSSCTLTVHKIKSPFRICQLRLDFIDFELNRPINGNCNADRFVVSGQNSNSMVPPLCGRNSGQHLFIDVDAAQGPFTLRITTSGNGFRRWNLKIIQIECGNPSRAPSNCLQYHTQQQGTIQSFNYEPAQLVPQIPSSAPVTNQATNAQQTSSYTSSNLPQNNDENTIINNGQQIIEQDKDETGYLNGLDYTICFRKENGFCSQTYYINSTATQFEIMNTDSSNNPTYDPNYSGVGIQKCPNDYLLLNNIRFCGQLWKFNHRNQNVNTESSIVDTSSGPFFARFVTDYHRTGRGFKLNFQQNPCGIFLQSNAILPISG